MNPKEKPKMQIVKLELHRPKYKSKFIQEHYKKPGENMFLAFSESVQSSSRSTTPYRNLDVYVKTCETLPKMDRLKIENVGMLVPNQYLKNKYFGKRNNSEMPSFLPKIEQKIQQKVYNLSKIYI